LGLVWDEKEEKNVRGKQERSTASCEGRGRVKARMKIYAIAGEETGDEVPWSFLGLDFGDDGVLEMCVCVCVVMSDERGGILYRRQ
jgi:hypothetical protein